MNKVPGQTAARLAKMWLVRSSVWVGKVRSNMDRSGCMEYMLTSADLIAHGSFAIQPLATSEEMLPRFFLLPQWSYFKKDLIKWAHRVISSNNNGTITSQGPGAAAISVWKVARGPVAEIRTKRFSYPFSSNSLRNILCYAFPGCILMKTCRTSTHLKKKNMNFLRML